MSPVRSTLTLLATLALAAASTTAMAQPMKKVLTGVAITCPANFKFEGGECKADAAAVAKLTADTCNVKGVAWVGTPAACVVVANQAPSPSCAATEPPSEFDAQLKACVVKDDRPRSALGNYVGDCFEIRALPAAPPAGVVAGQTYMVVSQRPEGESDKLLRLAETESGAGTFNCRSKVKGKEIDVKASDLIAIGADRKGWTYGVLALPYKFHFDDKSFGAGVSIGPYVGRRWGTPGSAYTFALAATIGSVKGEIRDSADKITSTPDLQAFSFAAGWMYDIAKGADTRPFKIGLFVGADVVGSDNTVKYKHNKKPWLAFQVGFDFTDN
jgi:hypothetical protein